MLICLYRCRAPLGFANSSYISQAYEKKNSNKGQICVRLVSWSKNNTLKIKPKIFFCGTYFVFFKILVNDHDVETV